MDRWMGNAAAVLRAVTALAMATVTSWARFGSDRTHSQLLSIGGHGLKTTAHLGTPLAFKTKPCELERLRECISASRMLKRWIQMAKNEYNF